MIISFLCFVLDLIVPISKFNLIIHLSFLDNSKKLINNIINERLDLPRENKLIFIGGSSVRSSIFGGNLREYMSDELEREMEVSYVSIESTHIEASTYYMKELGVIGGAKYVVIQSDRLGFHPKYSYFISGSTIDGSDIFKPYDIGDIKNTLYKLMSYMSFSINRILYRIHPGSPAREGVLIEGSSGAKGFLQGVHRYDLNYTPAFEGRFLISDKGIDATYNSKHLMYIKYLLSTFVENGVVPILLVHNERDLDILVKDKESIHLWSVLSTFPVININREALERRSKIKYNKMFRNKNHLNHKGAINYSEIFIPEIVKLIKLIEEDESLYKIH